MRFGPQEKIMNGDNPPLWQAHTSANYDEIMTARCAEVLTRLGDDAAYRVQIRSDPRPLHRYLFHGFTPDGYGEYAGTYRGQPSTSLFGRISIAESALTVDERYTFCAPEEVGGRMQALTAAVDNYVVEARTADHRLSALAFQFAWLGRIHPFLDGNGHVQRALFAGLALEFGYQTNNRFTIHPRPYDRLFAIALELFARAPEASANLELGIVGEYLKFYIS
jgi:fido (protein-threonine AMPylation protein)